MGTIPFPTNSSIPFGAPDGDGAIQNAAPLNQLMAPPPAPLDHEEKQNLFMEILRNVRQLDQDARDYQLRECRLLELYWRGETHIFWDETSKDYKTQQEYFKANNTNEEELLKTINVLKANGESIIAAMSAGLPSLRYFPQDADNPDDVMAAKAKSRLGEMIQNDNGGASKLAHALYILMTQHFVAAYINHHTSGDYGYHKEYGTKEVESETTSKVCPNCSSDVDDYNNCPECGLVEPVDETFPSLETQTTVDKIPKAKEIIELYGPLNVKIPMYVSDQKDAGYVLLETDLSIEQAKGLYPEYEKKMTGSANAGLTYQTNARRFYGTNTSNESKLVICSRLWLRPWMYWMLSDDDHLRIKTMYPDGCYVVFMNDTLVDCISEKLDDYWEFYRSPTSNFLNAFPLLRPMIPVQEMTDDLFNLTLDTIKHGVTETFADPRVLNFKLYGQTKAKAGLTFPAKSLDPDKNLSQYFFERKPASLSREVDYFASQLEQAGQLVTGAFPSVFGGVAEGGSHTAKEYELSRAQALQRLSLVWKAVSLFWAKTIAKAIELYIASWPYDTNYARPQGSGFINVWVRQSELKGDTGKVEPEVAEDFPISWSQQSDRLMQLIGMNNPALNSAIFDSQNVGLVARLIGISNAVIPGESDRDKQLLEIQELIKVGPNEESLAESGAMMSSIQPEPVDNNEVHASTCRNFLISPAGIELKNTNPQGYANVMAHMQEHLALIAPPPTMGPDGKPMPQDNSGAPAPGEEIAEPAQ